MGMVKVSFHEDEQVDLMGVVGGKPLPKDLDSWKCAGDVV